MDTARVSAASDPGGRSQRRGDHGLGQECLSGVLDLSGRRHPSRGVYDARDVESGHERISVTLRSPIVAVRNGLS